MPSVASQDMLQRTHAEGLAVMRATSLKALSRDKPSSVFRETFGWAAIDGFDHGRRLSRAKALLRSIARSNAYFMVTMDAVAFPDLQRPTRAMRLRYLGADPSGDASSVNPALGLPDLTVGELTDWIDRFAGIDGPRILEDSSQSGLRSLTLQADTLFWQLLPVVAYTRSSDMMSAAPHTLARVFKHERVSVALDHLVARFDDLAGLERSVTSG